MKRESPAKKHHFWILLGLVPLLTLIAVVVVDAKVGGEIDKRQGEIKAANDEIARKNDPKPEKLIKALDKVSGIVNSKQDDLHQTNWNRQKNLFTWPGNSPRVFKPIEEQNLKFGAPLPDLSAIFDELRRPETYQYEYSSLNAAGTNGPGTGMADRVAPTQFLGGWRSVLRHVNDFGQVTVNKDQVWLILEDMWVQRSLLGGVRAVNEEMASFRRVDDPAKAPAQSKTHRVFRNRVWELDLELTPEGPSYRLGGTLTNISDRLQLMGTGNVMTLHVWLSPAATAQPMVFKIGGEFLPGRGATKAIRDKDGKPQVVPANVLQILPVADHVLPAGSVPNDLEIARVEQVFDVRTVPIKRVDALVMGQLGVDARNAGQPLLPPLATTEGGLFTEAFVKDPQAATGADGMPEGGMPPPVTIRPPTFGGPGEFGGATGARAGIGGGPLALVVDANKKRYLARTPQVRRMPVGMVVVVDQAYLQDVLLALSNSPLRFQITQVAWTRYRGTLDGAGIGGAGSTGVGSGGVDSAPVGTVNFGGIGEPGRAPGFGPPRPPIGTAPPPYPGSEGGMSGGYPGSGGPSAVSDSQITSGLVELSVYGIVSLYEKYEAAKPADATAPTP